MSHQSYDVHLHAEIELLKNALTEKQSQLIAMETACMRESDRQVELEDSIIAWQDKYDRLYESHKRVQKVNQNLEDKLLKLVDRNSGERAQLTSDVATLSVRLAQANYNIANLQREIERYKTDMGLAIQLLQCKPDSFVSQKISSLPHEIQNKVATYMRLDTNSHSDSEGSTSGVGVATPGSYCVLPASDSPPPACPFPPTAMVYSMRGIDGQQPQQQQQQQSSIAAEPQNEQMISPALMAKYLEDELKSSEIKHCGTCHCSTKDLTVLADLPKSYSVGTQTHLHGDAPNSLCLRCNSNLNSPSRTNSPYIMKLVKSSDSVISETKSSVSGSSQNEKLFTPAKKDDLMVNPILGHHRLCDRTVSVPTTQRSNTPLTVAQLLDSAVISKPDEPKVAEDSDIDEIEDNVPEVMMSAMLGDERPPKTLPMNTTTNSPGTVSGSTNSLWSKSSSNTGGADGAKLFESFNRNLIKTIQAENPKTSGPRLCALRIQNGSNNILLDSAEPNQPSPVVYTRRQRFLDEELDDTKEVITTTQSVSTVISMAMAGSTAGVGGGAGVGVGVGNNKTDSEKFREAHSATTPLAHDHSDPGLVEVAVVANAILPPIVVDRKMNGSSAAAAAATVAVTMTGAAAAPKKIDCDTNSSANAKSITQTVAQSLPSDVELQETALLRRQQLNRVAEWVQHNSMQLDNGVVENSLNHNQIINNNNNNDHNISNSSSRSLANCRLDTDLTNNNNLASSQSSLRAFNTHPLLAANNNNCASLSLSDDKKLVSGSGCSSIRSDIAQSKSADMEMKIASVGNSTLNAIDTVAAVSANTQVDLAQMEYNVKQFLLKQNEWSIHNKQQGSTTAATTASIQYSRSPPHRTETNL